jgi:uncharacterized protein YaiL (DUF2058 family)
MIEGNIASYSRILNDPQRLDSLRDLNKRTAAVASVSADKQEQLEKNKRKTKEKTKERTRRRQKTRLRRLQRKRNCC